MYSCDHVQAGGFSCQERVAIHAHVTAAVKLQSHEHSRDAVGEDVSRRGGTSVGGGGRKSLSQGGEEDLEASQDAEG